MKDTAISPQTNLSNAPADEEELSALHIWGGHPLSGEVTISGAKNSALALMAGAILCPQQCRLRNLPDLVDIQRMGDVLKALGVKLHCEAAALTLDASQPEHVGK
ncbi:MAG: UDP-N-acetylglucosamine 1-carboxyvinyltransferase, partial [Spirulinaceae cyanobacterium RM2_2_10]|nr:UDP-N-acetylglucosamine 1-carboxyvinyltransferase [Spirulinaceae cyanobacterium RM2_2_10]